jgi:rhamnosyltransferase
VTSEGAPAAGAVGFLGGASVCAVIVTHNIGEPILRCFSSIHHQVGRVVLVDNGSEEPTRRELDKLASQDSVTVILNERNEGIAHAFNQGVKWALDKGYGWVLMLDHDSTATPGMVELLIRAGEVLRQQGQGDVGIIGANPFDENGHVYLKGHRPGDTGGKPIEIGHLISSGSMIAGRVFDKVGLFDEALFLYYVDDDFCWRLRKAGFRLFLCPEAVLLHREGGKETRSFLGRRVFYDHYGHSACYYLTRNAIYMMRKHALGFASSRWLVRRLVVDTIKVILYDPERFSKLRFSLNGLADALRGKFGPMSSRAAHDKWGPRDCGDKWL